MDRRGDAMVGQLLGGYRVEEVLGHGGMGVVYRATQPRLQRSVALKVIAPALADDSVFRERFERESALAASIDHPHVLPVYEAGEDAGTLYLAMRYVEGTDLAELLRRYGPLPPTSVVRLVTQLASALDAAHRSGLVHRDVKPANVLVAGAPDDGHAYLTDFGLTKRSGSQTGVTATGQWMGTLDYVAPEQIKGDDVDARADIYALGCLLYELLTGRKPYARDTDVATIWAHISEPPPAPSAVDASLPGRLDGVVARALAKDPADRYSTAGGLADAAAGAVAGVADAVPTTAPQAAASSRTAPQSLRELDTDDGDTTAFGAVSALIATAALLWTPYVTPFPNDFQPLGPMPSGAELVAHYTQFRTVNLFQAGVVVVSMALLIGFWWALPRLVGGPERPIGVLAKTVRTAGIAASAAQFVSGMFAVAPTFQLAGDGNTDLVEALWYSGIQLGAVNSALTAIAAAGAATIAFRHRGRRSSIGWLCVVAAAAAAISSISELTGGQYLPSAATEVVSIWIVAVALAFLIRRSLAAYSDTVARRSQKRLQVIAAGGLALALSLMAQSLLPTADVTVMVGPDSPLEDVELYYQQVGGYLVAASAINALGIVLSIGLWWALREVTHRARTWSVTGLVTGVAAALFGLIAASVQALPVIVSSAARTSASLEDLSVFTNQFASFAGGLAIGCFAAAALKSATLPVWLGWSGLAIALATLASATVQLSLGEKIRLLDGSSFVVFLAWTTAAAVVVMVRRPVTTEMDTVPAA